jgi:hypothetical protein
MADKAIHKLLTLEERVRLITTYPKIDRCAWRVWIEEVKRGGVYTVHSGFEPNGSTPKGEVEETPHKPLPGEIII